MVRIIGDKRTIGGQTENYFWIDYFTFDDAPNNRTYVEWSTGFRFTGADAQLDDADASLAGLRYNQPGRVYNFASNFTTRDVVFVPRTGPGSAPFYVSHDANGNGSMDINGSCAGNIGARSSITNRTITLTNYDRSPTTPTTPSVTRTSNGSGISAFNFTGGVNNSGPTVSYERRVSVNSNMSGYSTFSGTTVSLTPNVGYYFQVHASNTDGSKTSSATGIVYGVPSAPTSPSATRSTSVSQRIDLAWVAPTNTQGGITGYNVYRKLSTDANFSSSPTYSLGNVLSYADTSSLTRGLTYNYKIIAKNAVGFNDSTLYSTSATVTAVAPGVPSAPGVPTVSVKVGRNLTLNSTRGSSDYGNAISEYRIQLSTDNGATWKGWNNTTKSFTANNTYNVLDGSGNFTYQLLSPALTYKWRVYAVNSIGTGDFATMSTGVFVSSGGKRWTGTQWTPTETAKRWDGTQWLDLTIAKRWDGSSWVDLT